MTTKHKVFLAVLIVVQIVSTVFGGWLFYNTLRWNCDAFYTRLPEDRVERMYCFSRW
jgi:hypothetical protein